MYALKPVIDSNMTINRPICMYEMNTIDRDLKLKFRIDSKDSSAKVKFLEERQKKILEILAGLNKYFSKLRAASHENNSQTSKSTTLSLRPQIYPIPEIVLNVSPSKPCYSLLVLGKPWIGMNLRVSSFVHSTIKSEVPKEFEKIQPNDRTHSINIILIWKEVFHTELVTSGVEQFPIKGETNFLRFLLRHIGNYEDAGSLESMKYDKIFDLSNLLVHQSPKNQQTTLDELNEILKSSMWFSDGNNPGICDVAAWSAVKQSLQKKLPPNLIGWYEKCENLFLK